MTTYGKYQPGKCGSCESNTATTVHNERPMCLRCAAAEYKRRRPRVSRTSPVDAAVYRRSGGKRHV